MNCELRLYVSLPPEQIMALLSRSSRISALSRCLKHLLKARTRICFEGNIFLSVFRTQRTEHVTCSVKCCHGQSCADRWHSALSVPIKSAASLPNRSAQITVPPYPFIVLFTSIAFKTKTCISTLLPPIFFQPALQSIRLQKIQCLLFCTKR